jgi:hypothetical protein
MVALPAHCIGRPAPRRKSINKISLQRSSFEYYLSVQLRGSTLLETPQIPTRYPEDCMDWNPRHTCRCRLTVLAISFATSACTNTEYVEVEATLQPPDSVAGSGPDVPTNQTTRQLPHNNQTEWAARHADARHPGDNPGTTVLFWLSHGVAEWNIYAANGVPGGWNAVPDSVYHNVQCEMPRPGVYTRHQSQTTNIPARQPGPPACRPASAVTRVRITRSRSSGRRRRMQPFATSPADQPKPPPRAARRATAAPGPWPS